jgi:hypothetical protein
MIGTRSLGQAGDFEQSGRVSRWVVTNDVFDRCCARGRTMLVTCGSKVQPSLRDLIVRTSALPKAEALGYFHAIPPG